MTLLYTVVDKLSNGREERKMKKSTGITRKVDELGRIVIPIEIRQKFGIEVGTQIEIYVNGSSIILEKFKDTYCPDCLIRCEHTDKFCRNCGKEF